MQTIDGPGMYGDEPGYGGHQGQRGGPRNPQDETDLNSVAGYTLSGNHDRTQQEQQYAASRELASGKKQREREREKVSVVSTENSVLLICWNLSFFFSISYYRTCGATNQTGI
jgi:hypothetical protein